MIMFLFLLDKLGKKNSLGFGGLVFLFLIWNQLLVERGVHVVRGIESDGKEKQMFDIFVGVWGGLWSWIWMVEVLIWRSNRA